VAACSLSKIRGLRSAFVQPLSKIRRVATLADKMQRLIYIASVGYSGSTLLDMVLGSNAEITSLGEVMKLSRFFSGEYGDTPCTCGALLKDCSFWTSISHRLSKRTGEADFKFENFPLSPTVCHHTIHRRVPSLAEVLLACGLRPLWNCVGKLSREVASYRHCAQRALALYETVSEIEKTPIIVDSSKEPIQLKNLYFELGKRMRIIFLVRDGRAVTQSLIKRRKLSFHEAAARWRRYNWNLLCMLRSIPKQQQMLVRYEDLCSETSKTFDRIAVFAGFSPSISVSQLRLYKERFHIVGGNPMRRRRDELHIQLDEKWRATMEPQQFELFEKLAGSMNRRFGYADQNNKSS
jgi:hypothetical protein